MDAFVIAGLLTLVGAVAVLLIHDRDAAASIAPRPVGPPEEATAPAH